LVPKDSADDQQIYEDTMKAVLKRRAKALLSYFEFDEDALDIIVNDVLRIRDAYKVAKKKHGGDADEVKKEKYWFSFTCLVNAEGSPSRKRLRAPENQENE
jgi:hypothetical protein